MLYAIPVLLIVGAGLYGCRPEERRLIVIIGAGTTIAFIPCLLIAQSTDRAVAEGFAYSLMVVGATQWAMLVGRRRGEAGENGGTDGGEPNEPRGPSPVDWPEFERRFWDEVRNSPRRRPPAQERRPRAPV